MARLGRSTPAPILRSGGRVWADASLEVVASVRPGQLPLSVPFILEDPGSTAGGINYTAESSSLEIVAGLGNQFPYTFPFTFQTSNTLAKTFGSDAEVGVTATGTAQINWDAYDESSGQFVAGFSAAATITTSIQVELPVTADLAVAGGRGQTFDSSLLTTASYNSAFPYIFPIVFSSFLVETTRNVTGDASLVLDTTDSPAFTRNQYADAHLEETADHTAVVWMSALLDSDQTITADRTEDSTRDAPVDTSVSGIASPFADAIQGRNVDADQVDVSTDISADAKTDLYADNAVEAAAAVSAEGQREAVFFSYDQIITADPTAEASIVAYAEAEDILIVASDSPTADRNANVDADLATTATADSEVYWDAQGLEANLDTTTDIVAQESLSGLGDTFGGEVAVTLTADATRNVFIDSDDLPITAIINDEDALRNVIVDADLPVTAEFVAIRSFEVFIDCEGLVVAASADSDLVKGRIGDVDLAVSVDITSDVTYGQPLDADHTTTADPTAGFSQMQALDGELLLAAGSAVGMTRNQHIDSEALPAHATVDSGVEFGAHTDTDLAITFSQYGEITRNHNADSPLDVTDQTTGAITFDALLDPDLPVTASSDIDFLRDAIVDADLAVTAGTFVIIYNDAETESQLYVDATIGAEATRNIFADANLSVTATAEAPVVSRGQLLDSEVLGIVTTDTDPLYNQFLDADMPVSNGPGGAVNFDALIDPGLVIHLSSLIDYTKGMSLDSLLALLAPTEERLKSDFITTTLPLTVLGDTDFPFAFMGRFLYADQPVTASIDSVFDMEALLESFLNVPATPTSGASELLSSNFFPFYL